MKSVVSRMCAVGRHAATRRSLPLLLGSLLLACPSQAAEPQRTVLAGGTVTLYDGRGTGAGPAPLVILLHGSSGEGASTLAGSKLAATAERHGFIVAAPDGAIALNKGYAWNIPGVPTAGGSLPARTDRDDVRYLLAMVDELVGRKLVDPARVYVTGISGGGRMASWLACVAPDRIAAIAPVVGLRAGAPRARDRTSPDPATCHPTTAMPILAFAGDADTVNPIGGGGSPYWGYGMHAAEARWATLNRCSSAPTTRWITSKVYEERYSGCKDGADVAARITVGGKHAWVADNEAMWEFFTAHHRSGN